jgi:hypothetical protein
MGMSFSYGPPKDIQEMTGRLRAALVGAITSDQILHVSQKSCHVG